MSEQKADATDSDESELFLSADPVNYLSTGSKDEAGLSLSSPALFTPIAMLSPQYRESEVFSVMWKDLQTHFRTSMFRVCKRGVDDKEFIKRCLTFCEKREELDIYQVLAFESTKTAPLTIREAWEHRLRIFKAFACSVTQLVFMTVVLYQLIDSALYHSDKTVCANFDVHSSAWYMNILACFVCLNFSFTIFSKIKVSIGLYQYILLIDYNLNWINHFWLYLGFAVNALVQLATIWASFFIIFSKTDAMGLIFAMISIFYVCTLDEKLIDGGDYEALKKIVVVELAKFDEAAAAANENGHKPSDISTLRATKKLMQECRFRDDKEEDKEYVYNKKRLCFYSHCRNCIKCCHRCDKGLVFLFGIPYMLVKYCTLIAAMCMPVYLLVCF